MFAIYIGIFSLFLCKCLAVVIMVSILFVLCLLVFLYSAFRIIVFLVTRRRIRRPIAILDLRKTEQSTTEFKANVGFVESETAGLGLIVSPRTTLSNEMNLLINENTERIFKVNVVESYPKSVQCGCDGVIELDFMPSNLEKKIRVESTERRKVAKTQIIFTSDRDKVNMKVKLVSTFFKVVPEEQTIELREDMPLKRHLEYTIYAKCYEFSLKGLAPALKLFLNPWGATRTVNIMGLVDGVTVFSEATYIDVFPEKVFLAVLIMFLIFILVHLFFPINISTFL